MDKQEGSLSGRCCAPWRQASALHKIGGRASAPPLAHQIFISPRSYFATTTRARTIVWNIDCRILFLTSHDPLPRAWPCLRRSFPLLLLLRPEVESLSFYVPPFKPAISLICACNVHRRPWGIIYRKRMHQWRNTSRVDCFLLVALARPLQNPIPSSRTKLCMSQRLLRITLSSVNKPPTL